MLENNMDIAHGSAAKSSSIERSFTINGVKVKMRFLKEPNTEFHQGLKTLLLTAYMRNSGMPVQIAREE